MLGSGPDLHEWFRRYLYTAMVAGASLVCAATFEASLAMPKYHSSHRQRTGYVGNQYRKWR